MRAGRELDAEVAKALGWILPPHTNVLGRMWVEPPMGRVHPELPHFSTDETAAFIAVRAMRDQGFRFRLQDLHSGIRQASFFNEREYGAMLSADTDAHAIALTVIAAKEATQ